MVTCVADFYTFYIKIRQEQLGKDTKTYWLQTASVLT